MSTGRRAITDGSIVHFGSYCASLRKRGATCSSYQQHNHLYTHYCPCDTGLDCKAQSMAILHPLLTIPTHAVCV
jgi:hypothetical protein